MAATLYKHRNNLLLELFQPVGLSLFAAAGSIATIASFLLAFSDYTITCALRQPIIITCITFMGNILLARAWRIGSIISPTATFASSSNGKAGAQFTAATARLKVMKALSELSRWGVIVVSCGRTKKLVRRTGMKRTITLGDSIGIAFMLLIPQLVLQIVNLSVPTVRTESVDLGEKNFICASSAGMSTLIIGIVLAAIPFFIALLINIKSEGMPDRFLEFDDILSSIGTSFCILIITLPTVGIIGSMVPTAQVYLLGASVLSFVLPLSYNIIQKRVNLIINTPGPSKAKGSTSASSNNKRRSVVTRRNTNPSLSKEKGEEGLQILKAAEEATVMGKMYESMGQKQKAADINRDILTLFKIDEEFSWEKGFTSSEVQSLNPKSLQIVVTTLISSAKLWYSVYISNPDDGEEAKSRTIKSCAGALDIFDKAPAKKQLRDRSIVFSGYSFMNLIAKTIQSYQPPNGMDQEEFDMHMAQSFLKETTYLQFHQSRALAFQADVMRKHGKYEDALLVVEELKSIYSPELHSKAIMKEYVTDHCIDIIAASTIWLHNLGRNEEALNLCDRVIDTMLPQIEATELVSKLITLIPVCRTLTNQRHATRASELFNTHVADPAAVLGSKVHPSVKFAMPPIRILFECRRPEGYKRWNEDIAFMLNGEEKHPEWTECACISYHDAALSTMCAEACICLARHPSCNAQDKASLIKESLQFLEASETILEKFNSEKGGASSMAHSYYCQIMSELENLSSPV